MSFADRELQCVDCGVTFTFTAGEQEFYETKGFVNDPKRCPDCRSAKKLDRAGGGPGSQRRMYSVVCAECGTETEVPFEPRGGRPVYCNSCYSANKANARY
ncbi:MAG: zinc-ribbon domain containing protein [Chloroflexota bacterium]|nr:zinc-ribbon domain containing protein [Chloroflexota bacterium]